MKSGVIFKVNGHRVKPYLEPLSGEANEVFYLDDASYI